MRSIVISALCILGGATAHAHPYSAQFVDSIYACQDLQDEATLADSKEASEAQESPNQHCHCLHQLMPSKDASDDVFVLDGTERPVMRVDITPQESQPESEQQQEQNQSVPQTALSQSAGSFFSGALSEFVSRAGQLIAGMRGGSKLEIANGETYSGTDSTVPTAEPIARASLGEFKERSLSDVLAILKSKLGFGSAPTSGSTNLDQTLALSSNE